MNKNIKTEGLWVFKRWSRKPWSVFASLSRLKIGVLSVAMSIILLATQPVDAQFATEDTLSRNRARTIDSVQLIVDYAAIAPVSQSLSLVERKDIVPFGTTEAALRLSPSFDVRERGGKSVQTDIVIRGGSFDQTMVMLNGIDFSDARTGHQSHSLPVDIDIVSSIVRMDYVSVPGALTGAVNFITRPAFDNYFRVRLEGGDHGYAYENLSGAWTRNFRNGDHLTVFGAGSYRRSDGYRHNTDFWNVNLYSSVVYDSRRAGRFDFQGGFQRRDWGSNGFYSLRFPDQFESTLTGLTSVRWTKTWHRFTLSVAGSFRQNNDRFEMVRGDETLIPFNRHMTYNIGVQADGSCVWRRAGVTSLGAVFIRHQMTSNALGDRQRNIWDIHAGHRKLWTLPSHHGLWVGGVASAAVTPYGTDGTFSVETGWAAPRVFSLTAGVVRSTRLPTFTDLFYNVATYHPNPALRPEQAMKYSLTARAEYQGLDASLTLYYRDTQNVIDWEQRDDGDWYSTQLNRLATIGAEVSVGYSSEGWFRIAQLNYGYIHSDMTVGTGYISKYALDYMRHKLSAVVGVGFPYGFSLTLTGSFYDRVGSYVDAAGVKCGYRPYFLLDGRFAWDSAAVGAKKRAGVQLYLDVVNITDTRYFDFGGLPMPGAWASAGVVLTIN